MSIKTYALLAVATLSLSSTSALAETKSGREYDIKAAFVCKFMLFTDWPQEKLPDDSRAIVLAIVGNDPFEHAFEPVKDESVKGRKIVVKYFKGWEALKEASEKEMARVADELGRCHLLFICRSEEKNVASILKMVKGHSVLTVADMPDFLESGGMINLLLEEGKVRFEVNNIAATEAELKIGSQLLRLAKRVVREESTRK